MREPHRGPRALAELRRALSPGASRWSAAQKRPPIPSGIASIDAALGGGLPAGRVVELCGDAGRMSLALRLVASASRRGLCAFIDGSDALDAHAAQELGVDLQRLLWARVRRPEDALRAADILLRAGGFLLLVLYLPGAGPLRTSAGTWQRLVQRGEHAGTALLLVSDEPQSGSAACATLSCRHQRVLWEPVPGGRSRLRGQRVALSVLRSRLGAPQQELTPLWLQR